MPIDSPFDSLVGIRSPFGDRRASAPSAPPAPAFDPTDLFPALGAIFDPSDITTLFQDEAGTVPVTADGDPVRLMLDVSGNGNHALAPNSSARAMYGTDGTHHWLDGDGVDDFYLFDHGIAGDTPRTIIFAVRSAGAGEVAEKGLWSLGGTLSDLGETWALFDETGGVALRVGGNTVYSSVLGTNDVVALHYWGPSLGVTNADAVLRLNGLVTSVSSSSAQAVNTNGGVPDNGRLMSAVTSSGEKPWAGRFYGGVVVDVLLTPQELSDAEAYYAEKMGITL